MRARGARVTDIAVIVVAADDGVKPQTDEAIDHAKAADVPIVVAVNKIDKEGADPTRVRTEMTTRGLQPAEWGGETEFVDVSAKSKVGLEDLLDTLQVVAELEDLKANPSAPASGVVVESKLDPGRGPVVTILIQRGTLRIGDALVAGANWGRVRAMHDFTGTRVKEALPGDPIEVLGFDGVPEAGEHVRAVENDRRARAAGPRARAAPQAGAARAPLGPQALAGGRLQGHPGGRAQGAQPARQGRRRRLRRGAARTRSPSCRRTRSRSTSSAPASAASTSPTSCSPPPPTRSSSASTCAPSATPAPSPSARASTSATTPSSTRCSTSCAPRWRACSSPTRSRTRVGTVEIRQIFRASKIGVIAGSYVTDGKITRGAKTRLVRDGTIVYDGEIASLRRVSEDVREVAAGFECGIVLRNFQDVKEGDVLEVYETRKVDRALA